MSAAAIPEPGELLAGRYRVVRLLGHGGMGAVLEAENATTGKRVAIKWLSPLLWGDQGKERFLREARAASRVRHPNVVDVYDFIDEGDRYFLVMQLLEGEPLGDLLTRGGVPLHEIIALLIEAMRGVAAAHAQGVIHRDIKPDNIFLERQADRAGVVPKVIDFGVSKITTGASLSLTESGATLGTPLYMSYEQLRGAKDVDVRTDVYSFGVILYEALTGQPPYEAASLTDLVVKLTTTAPQRLKALRPEVPTALDNLVHWAMAIDREQRVPSIEALIRELEPFATEHGFRSQMTIEGATIPRVAAGPSGAPVTRPAAVAPRPTPRTPAHAETPVVPARPRRGTVLVGAITLGAISLYLALRPGGDDGAEKHALREPSAPQASVAAAALPPPAPAPASDAGAPPERDVPATRATKRASRARPAAAPHAVERAPAAPAPSEREPDPEPKFRAGRALREDF